MFMCEALSVSVSLPLCKCARVRARECVCVCVRAFVCACRCVGASYYQPLCLLLLKYVRGIFNVDNDLNACCAHNWTGFTTA